MRYGWKGDRTNVLKVIHATLNANTKLDFRRGYGIYTCRAEEWKTRILINYSTGADVSNWKRDFCF